MITIIVGRAAQFLLGLATLRVATTLLSPEEIGKTSLILTTTACFAMFLVNPVGMFINRRLHTWELNGLAKVYLKMYAEYLLLVGLVASTVIFVLNLAGAIKFDMHIGWLIGLVCGSLFFNTINQTAIPSLNMLGYSRAFVVLSVITLVASFISAVALVSLFRAEANYWVLGLLLGQSLLAVVGTKALFTKLSSKSASPVTARSLKKKQLHRLYEFTWPVAIAAGFAWVQAQGYRYILQSQLGLAELGLFVAGYGISAGVIAGFESVLTTYFQPNLYRDAAHENRQVKAWRHYASAVIPSLILTTVLIVELAPELTRLFLGEKFQSASNYVICGAFAESARAMTGVYSLIAHVFMQTRWLVLPSLVGAAVAVLMTLLLIPHFGAIGAGISLTLAGILVVGFLHILLVHRVGGGILMQKLTKLTLAAFALWIATYMTHAHLGKDGYFALFGSLVSVGVVYLVLVYFLLREHLVRKVDV